MSGWRICSAINDPRTSVWLTGLRSRWCLPPLSPRRSVAGQLIQIDVATPRAGQVESQCRSPRSHCSGQLVRKTAIGAGDVTTSHANRQAPATEPEAKDVLYYQEVVATPPMGQAA